VDVNTQELAQILRAAGRADWADNIERGEQALGAICGVIQSQQRSTSMAQIPQNPAGQWNAGQNTGNPFNDCTNLIELVSCMYKAQCGLVPEPCLASWIAWAVMMSSIAEVRDDFSVRDLAVVPSGLLPTGMTANGQSATTFVANFPIIPGNSILMKVQPYRLPFNPRCLWGLLAFNGGDTEQNYLHVLFKLWVGPRDPGTSPFPLDHGLAEWDVNRWIYGSEFRCGHSCKEVALKSYTACTDADIVGINSTLYIQIDNLITASNNITGQQLVIKLGGFKRPCCNDCAMGRACSTGCGNHKH
jgi:hypothetical protein